MKDSTLEWMNESRDDEEMARRAMQIPPIPKRAAFQAQQAVEKALKGLLAEWGIAFPRKHDLLPLLHLIGKQNAVFKKRHTHRCAELERKAVFPRYPGYPVTLMEAQKAIRNAGIICKDVRRILSVS